MAKYRPTGVLVIAILHLIGGTLGLLIGLWAIAMLALGSSMTFGTPPAPPPGAPNQQVQEMLEFQKKIEHQSQNPPGGQGLQYAMSGVDLMLSGMMLAAGVGLIMMRPWARTLSIVYAVLSILLHLFQVAYAFGFMIPAFRAVLDQAPQGNQFLDMFVPMMNGIMIVSAVVGFLFIIYPIVVLIVMLKPSTAAAFRGEYVDPYAPRHRPHPTAEEYDYDEPFRRDEPDDRYRADER